MKLDQLILEIAPKSNPDYEEFENIHWIIVLNSVLDSNSNLLLEDLAQFINQTHKIQQQLLDDLKEFVIKNVSQDKWDELYDYFQEFKFEPIYEFIKSYQGVSEDIVTKINQLMCIKTYLHYINSNIKGSFSDYNIKLNEKDVQ